MIDVKPYYTVMTDAWRFFRKYAEQIPLSDEQWAAAVKEAEAFYDQHAGCRRMAGKMITQVVDELEHLDREQGGTK